MIVAALTLCVIGCDSVFAPQSGGKAAASSSNTGKGLVCISIGTEAGRTLRPAQTDLVVDQWELAFTGVAAPSITINLSSTDISQPVQVDAGEWTLALEAKKDGTVIASGAASGTVTVSAGLTASAAVTLTFAAPGGGAGGLLWSITDNSGLAACDLTIELLPLNGGSAETIGLSLAGTKSDINAGYYLVSATLSGDGKKAVKSDVAHIYKGQTTKFAWTFEAADLHAAIERVWLVGAMNATAWTLPGTEMTARADGAFAWTGPVSGDRRFRFSLLDTSGWPDTDNGHAGDNKWWGHWFAPENDGAGCLGSSIPVNYYHYTKKETAWQLAASGWYKIALDPYTKTMEVAALTPPAISGAAITNAAKSTVTVTFNKSVTMTGSAPYGFTVNGSPAIAIGGISGSGAAWTFMLAREATEGETITLAYSGDAVKDADGVPLQAITGQSVTNTVKAYPQLLTAAIENAAPDKLVLTFSKAVTIGGSAPYGFTLNVSSAMNITGTNTSGSQTIWTLNLDRAVNSGETITLSYSGSSVVDGDSNNPQAISAMTVTNNVGLTQVLPATNVTLGDNGTATWTASTDEANINNYTVKLYRETAILVETQTVAASVGTYNFLSKICDNLSAGPQSFYITLAANGKPGYADSTLVTSSTVSVTQLARAALLWSNGAAQVELTGSAAVSASFTIPAGKTLVIPQGKTVSSGKLILAAGTWEATNANVAITADTVTLGSHASPGFGSGTGATSTVLTGGADTANTFTATGTTVTLSQENDGKTIKVEGSAVTGVLTLGTSARIFVKDGLKIDSAAVAIPGGSGAQVEVPANGHIQTINGGVLESGDLLELGTGWWLATGLADSQVVALTANVITLGSNNWVDENLARLGTRFGANSGVSATVLAGGKNSPSSNTFTASGGKVTLSQNSNELIITGTGASPKLKTGDTAGIWIPDRLTINSLTLDIESTSEWTSPLAIQVQANGFGGWNWYQRKIILSDANSIILLDSSKLDNQGDGNWQTWPHGELLVGSRIRVKHKDGKIGAFSGGALQPGDNNDENFHAIRDNKVGPDKWIARGLTTP